MRVVILFLGLTVMACACTYPDLVLVDASADADSDAQADSSTDADSDASADADSDASADAQADATPSARLSAVPIKQFLGGSMGM